MAAEKQVIFVQSLIGRNILERPSMIRELFLRPFLLRKLDFLLPPAPKFKFGLGSMFSILEANPSVLVFL